MRRSRTPLMAWPAFADLMTILAVVGLAIAAALAGSLSPDESPEEPPAAPGDSLAKRVEDLEQQLAAARERNVSLVQQVEDLERQLSIIIIGGVPCLGTQPGSPNTPVPLLRIVVDSGYVFTRLSPLGADVENVPRLDDAINHGLMNERDLRRYAGGIHAYGNAEDTYGRSCRFFVELGKSETESQTTFARALGIVNQYFLLSNSSEVNRILVGTE